ncbi:hypothetical protein JMJ77_0001945, partial [Colletotrichum scovillei]
ECCPRLSLALFTPEHLSPAHRPYTLVLFAKCLEARYIVKLS